MPVDCGKAQLCALNSICNCTATECHEGIGTPTMGGIAFDMQLAAGALNGSVTGLDSTPLNVHLMRQ